jgi:hypothetical protein
MALALGGMGWVCLPFDFFCFPFQVVVAFTEQRISTSMFEP